MVRVKASLLLVCFCAAFVGIAGVHSAELPADLSPDELILSLTSIPHDEQDAWRELATAWKLTLAGSDPCLEAPRQQVHCFRSNTNLALIRQLDRPGILTLHDTVDGTRQYALLTGLTRQRAMLQIGGQTRNISLAALSTLWQGEFSTFWRVPAGYAATPAGPGSGPFGMWLAMQLTSLRPVGSTVEAHPRDSTLNAQVTEFQRSQGLKTDGIAGPTTFMQLNRATGVDEPRLLATPPSH